MLGTQSSSCLQVKTNCGRKGNIQMSVNRIMFYSCAMPFVFKVCIYHSNIQVIIIQSKSVPVEQKFQHVQKAYNRVARRTQAQR